MEHWYAVHTKARDEKLAEENLKRQGFATFLPLIKAQKRRRGRWTESIEPLFPRLSLHSVGPAAAGQLYHPLHPGRPRPGALWGLPGPVPPGLVEQLRAATASEEGVVRQEHLFHPGDRVEILTGPFAGLPASILAETGKERVELLLDLLGRANKVVISRHQLTPAP
jgi:transcriptional antiterminator RfaH